ncbi:MFS transporter [Hydrogenophaga sp. 5NK40-0174]|uniref:MFS transporter n=1 Tax=Hydrogenophaga sp. 5NK40-0174 TaxID=3127649 RepID=UPI00310C2BB6
MTPTIRQAVFRLVLSQISINTVMTGMRMAGPLMVLRQGQGALTAGLLMSLFAVSQVLLALPAGRLTNRYGLRKPVWLAAALVVTGAALGAIWPRLEVLCVSALLCGAANNLTLISVQRHAGLLTETPAQLRQVFSWMAIGPSASNFLGPMMAGVVIDAAGYRVAFLALAFVPMVALALIGRVTEIDRVAPPEGEPKGSAWDLLRNAAFARLMAVNWAMASCWNVHSFIVPLIGVERGVSATVIGSILGSFAIAATVIRVLIPCLARHLHEATVIGGAMLVSGLVLGAYPFAPNPWWMGMASALLGLVLGSVQPMVMSALHQITPRHRHAEALALRTMAINGSSAIMPTVFGLAGAYVGAAGVSWAVGLLVGGLAWLPRSLRGLLDQPPGPQRVMGR